MYPRFNARFNDCDCPGGPEFCQLNGPCESCMLEILERNIDCAMMEEWDQFIDLEEEE